MFINNLQFWVSSVLSLLININQETILDFLGIDGPFNSEDYSEFFGASQISTPVSIETFKLIIQSIWEHYQHGLGFVDIENIAIFILVLRFIFLSRKYNIKTAFIITGIGLSAGFVWYMHLKDLANYYAKSTWMCPLTHNLAYEYNEVFTQTVSKYHRVGNRFDSTVFYGPIVKAFKDITIDRTNNGDYRYDPISMLWTYLPTNVKFVSDKIYYLLTLKIIPQIYRYFTTQFMAFTSLMWYTVIVRINKRYCPYLLRWHWTFLLTISYFEKPFIYIHNRLLYYLDNILIPNGYFRECQLVTVMIITLIAGQYILILLGLLHALCGQYFYFPFITENTELHIGPRPKDSIYSGGYTVWQNRRAFMISREASTRLGKYRSGTIRAAYSLLPRVWYGWLGRGNLNDLTAQEYEEYLKTKENKESIKKAEHRDSKIRWYYRQERLKKRFIKILAKFGIKLDNINSEDNDDNLYEEFKNFTKK